MKMKTIPILFILAYFAQRSESNGRGGSFRSSNIDDTYQEYPLENAYTRENTRILGPEMMRQFSSYDSTVLYRNQPSAFDEDDVELSENQIQEERATGHVRINHWQGAIYYQVSSDFSEHHYGKIQKAWLELASLTCIKVIEWKRDATPTGDYVFVEKVNGTCSSTVGRSSDGGKQILKLRTDCMTFVLHEVLHAYGLQHEHQRPDRDDNIIIHWEEVSGGKNDKNWKLHPDQDTFDVEYDINSVMHYPHNKGPTGGYQMDSKFGLKMDGFYEVTELDKIKIRKLYCKPMQA